MEKIGMLLLEQPKASKYWDFPFGTTKFYLKTKIRVNFNYLFLLIFIKGDFPFLNILA